MGKPNDNTLLPDIPQNMPRGGNRLTRWVGRSILRLMGWRVTGELPNLKQLVLCGAPHTSNWDFVLAMAVSLAVGVKFSYLMKKEAFFWPFKNLFMSMGGIPLDRAADTVDQIAQWYRDHEYVWLAITPEGTRTKVDKWKTGFLRIAHEAQVPVLVVSWHGPDKTVCLDTLWQTTGNHQDDADEIKRYVDKTFVGIRPENQ